MGAPEHGIEAHEPLCRTPCGHSSAIAALRLANRVIERLVMDVIEAGAVVDAVGGDGIPTLDDLLEKRVALLAAGRNAGERRVLSFDAQPAVAHHEHEKSSLTLGEAVVGDGLNAFMGGHSQSSSASPPLLLP